MRGKDYWNIITHNAKRVTSPGWLRRGCASDSLCDISGILFFLCNTSRNTLGMSCAWVYFYP